MTTPLESSPAADDHPRSHTLTFKWSRPASEFLATLLSSRRDINAAARSAARLTLEQAPVLFPALLSHLEKNPSAFAIDVAIVDDMQIHEWNHDHRGKNKPTDVLSYPVWEAAEDDEADLNGFWAFGADDEEEEGAEEAALGDLIISIETAARQANDLRHHLEEEIAFLTIHGTLHLLGYDHMNARDRKIMWKQQDALFDSWKMVRARRRRKPVTAA